MKQLLIVLVVFSMSFAVQAQEETKDIYIKEGKLIKATLHHDDGSIAQEGYYTKDGALTGQWISYDRTGKKTAKAQYENGEKVGTWFFWTADKLTEVNYSNSQVASVNVWENKSDSEVVINR